MASSESVFRTPKFETYGGQEPTSLVSISSSGNTTKNPQLRGSFSRGTNLRIVGIIIGSFVGAAVFAVFHHFYLSRLADQPVYGECRSFISVLILTAFRLVTVLDQDYQQSLFSNRCHFLGHFNNNLNDPGGMCLSFTSSPRAYGLV